MVFGVCDVSFFSREDCKAMVEIWRKKTGVPEYHFKPWEPLLERCENADFMKSAPIS